MFKTAVKRYLLDNSSYSLVEYFNQNLLRSWFFSLSNLYEVSKTIITIVFMHLVRL